MSKPMLLTLGNTPDLARLEIEALIRRIPLSASLSLLHPQQGLLNLTYPQADVLQRQSGSLIKVAQVLVTGVDYDSLVGHILHQLLLQSKTTHFALSSFTLSRSELHALATDIKKSAPKPAAKHFRILKSPQESAGITTKYHEFQLIKVESGWLLAFTTHVQDLKHWSIKDRSRPSIDPQSGMLPPKIARILVNLSLPTHPSPHAILYDPFCGSGTLLIEALDLGISAFGTDISTTAIEDAKNNCDWYTRRFNPSGQFDLKKLDVTSLSKADVPLVDAVAFEGYLGPPQIKPTDIPNLIKGLTKLYKGFFKRLPLVTRPGTKVVAALPLYRTKRGDIGLDSLIAFLPTIDYTSLAEPITYARPQAKVQRQIFQFLIPSKPASRS